MRKKMLKENKAAFIFILALLVFAGWMAGAVINKSTQAATYSTYKGVVVVDAGHGGFDSGTIGRYTKVQEDGINLQVAKKLQTVFEKNGYLVVMTREDENAVGYTKAGDMAVRRRIIEQSGADIVISIHMNRYPSANVSGPQVFYFKASEEGKILADGIQENLNGYLQPARARQAAAERFYILRSGEAPCVLVECGFLSNPHEEKMLQDNGYQQKVAEAIFAGAECYLKERARHP